ncbi:MAG: hypothetical protein N3F04_02690 [Candidatus Nezhaarchaeota archaeon]|nr:hypothetical protein [Candidatus Nezhaarchaeota archaeon]MCX8141678.1 hypothetical protein [Candidatus Nezhaarchaeota archaeon]MDW8049945.1 hypothetical protein [Nitrososphaerota archaeon]
MYHTALATVCEVGGHLEVIEVPEGVRARLIDDQGEVLSEAVDITWAPACLRSMLNAGIFPEEYHELRSVLTSDYDLKRVKEVFGYGRIVRPVAIALAKLMIRGGRAEVYRDGLGTKVIFYGPDGKVLSEASNIFCPACAAMIALTREPQLSLEVKEALRGEENTGKIKAERGIVSKVYWRNFRVEVELYEGSRKLGSNYGCCTAYAIVRAEAVCGLASPKGLKLIKAYCDQCPVKHLWMGKSMGAMGNVVLKRMSDLGLKLELSYDDFIKVTAKDKERTLGYGFGSLCALSASMNLLLRNEGIKIVRPQEATPLRSLG